MITIEEQNNIQYMILHSIQHNVLPEVIVLYTQYLLAGNTVYKAVNLALHDLDI
jgi:hypothetical protein